MATAAASQNFFLFHSDNSTADHQSARFGTVFFICLVFILGLILLLVIWLKHRENYNLTTTQGVELVNGTSRSRQESSGYSSQMTVVSGSNHPSVVHTINSNGAWDQAVVAGVSESTRAGGTSTVDERSVVVTPGYSSQMTVVSGSNHPSVVHAINSNGPRDEAVVAGVSESTRAGGTSTVDERSVVVTPARLNECVIDVLCISEYRADEGLHDGSSGETTECAICLGEITDGQTVRFLPECCHAFHVQCIDAWLTVHLSCPLCRRAV